MKIFVVLLLLALSVQALLPGGLAKKAPVDGRLTVSSGFALGALTMASSSGNLQLADASRRRRRRRRRSGRRRFYIPCIPGSSIVCGK